MITRTNDLSVSKVFYGTSWRIPGTAMQKMQKKMIYNGIPSEMYTSQIKYYITFKNRKFFSFDTSFINLDMK